ncbi:MAG: response regulator [Armatimonadetes bacterium]|nr:response regulator [Armatimonadota bacterium]
MPDTAVPPERGTILVADDEPNIVTLLTGWIETIGCAVVPASNGEEAIEQARKHRPDVILMDAMMPRMSGFEACAQIKKDPELKDIPILFLTVRNEIQDVVHGLELGAHGYIIKPFKPQELLARLRSVLRIKRLQDGLRCRTRELQREWDWTRTVLQQLPVPVLVLDGQGRAVYWNCAGIEAIGYSPAELADSRGEVLSIRGEGAGDLWDSGTSRDGRFEVRTRNGSWLPARILARPLDGPEGGGKSLVFVLDQ